MTDGSSATRVGWSEDNQTLTAIGSVRVGHWTDEVARTGCTVALFPAGTVASGEVRGGAPATREWALLEPHRLVHRLDAIVLSGGSAFGLAACDGVMRFCEERGMGFPTRVGPVPIVVGASLYDLGVGDAAVRPGPAEGYAACADASASPVATGRVGAGTGATVGKHRGPEKARPGGLGSAARGRDGVVVAAMVAVNAFGDVRSSEDEAPALVSLDPFANTTIGVVATNARLDKVGCLLVAHAAHDGLARALSPVHATVDGDALVAASAGDVEAAIDEVSVLAAAVVEDAVRTVLGAAPEQVSGTIRR